MKKAFGLLVLLGIAGLLGWQVYRKVTTAKKPPGRPGRGAAVAVEAAAVRTATVRDIEQLSGTLRPRSEFIVAARIAGRLEKLEVNIGERVKREQLIAALDAEECGREVEQARAELEVAKANAEQIRLDAALDDAELVQKVAQAKAAVGIAKASLGESRSKRENAQREFERAQALREKKIQSQAELDTAEAAFKTAQAQHEVALADVAHKEAALASAQVRLSETQKNARAAELKLAAAQVAQKEAALRAAEVRLSYTQIKAPWSDGGTGRVVGERFVDEGAMLKANDPIVSVLDIDALKAVVHVTERDYSKMAPGQPVTVTTDAFADRTFEGKIVRVAPVLKEASRQARVEIEVPNPEHRLKPGMFIRARIELDSHEKATVVPRDALVRRNGRQGVFVVDAKELRAHFVAVKVGIMDGSLAELVDPPARLAAASVVTLGHHLLEDGSAITLPGAAAEAEPPSKGEPPKQEGQR